MSPNIGGMFAVVPRTKSPSVCFHAAVKFIG
jgi:hypothetical protein